MYAATSDSSYDWSLRRMRSISKPELRRKGARAVTLNAQTSPKRASSTHSSLSSYHTWRVAGTPRRRHWKLLFFRAWLAHHDDDGGHCPFARGWHATTTTMEVTVLSRVAGTPRRRRWRSLSFRACFASHDATVEVTVLFARGWHTTTATMDVAVLSRVAATPRL